MPGHNARGGGGKGGGGGKKKKKKKKRIWRRNSLMIFGRPGLVPRESKKEKEKGEKGGGSLEIFALNGYRGSFDLGAGRIRGGKGKGRKAGVAVS